MNRSLYSFYDLFVTRPLLRDLYREQLLVSLTAVWVVFAVIAVVVYYKFLDKPRYANLGTWLLVALTACVTTAIWGIVTCYQMAGRRLPRNPDNPQAGTYFDQGGSVFFGFGLELALLCFLLYLIGSLIIRRTAINNRNIPL